MTPIFLLFILAIAEGSLYMNNLLAVSNTVRAGARTASAAGAATGSYGSENPSADLHIVHTIAKESGAIPRSSIEFIVIYRATGFDGKPLGEEEDGVPSGCLNGSPRAGLCNVYTSAEFGLVEEEMEERTRHAEAIETDPTDELDLSKIHFGCGTASPDRFWCPSTREDRLQSNSYNGPDYVGVYMKVRHKHLTGIFGDTNYITDQSVIKIEPRRK